MNGVVVMYFDGAEVTRTVSAPAVGTADLTDTDWTAGALATSGFDQFEGSIGRFAIRRDVALDVTDPAVRVAMADEAQAASPGDNLPDLHGLAEIGAGTSRGSGGDFVVTGAFPQ